MVRYGRAGPGDVQRASVTCHSVSEGRALC